jgi:uncharacterized protein YhfF
MTRPGHDEAVRRMWTEYLAATGTRAELIGAFAFGNTPEMADELADLVLHGPKRATAGLHLDHVRDGDPVPEPGDHWIVLDGRGAPVCVVRTTDVEVKPLNQVDAAFAWDEGEGDRTLDWWRRAHHRYFAAHCARIGVPFTEDLDTVFERFDLVWPRAADDTPVP